MRLSGSITALATPFTPAGDIDLDAWQRLLRQQLDGGTQALVVAGSTGEAAALDAVELRALTTLFTGHAPVVTSVKGALGEFGACGSAACAAAFLCGSAGKVPPVTGLARPDAAGATLRLAREPMDAPGPVTLVNSFASGGALFSAVLRTAVGSV